MSKKFNVADVADVAESVFKGITADGVGNEAQTQPPQSRPVYGNTALSNGEREYCPREDKTVFFSRRDAESFNRKCRMDYGHPLQRAYPCVFAAHWHLATVKVQEPQSMSERK